MAARPGREGKGTIARRHAVTPPTVMGCDEDVIARIGHHLEVARMLLAERHGRGEGLDSHEVSSLHCMIGECSNLLWNGAKR